MTQRDYSDCVHEHVHGFFSGHAASRETFDKGPIQSLIPGFHSIVVQPGPQSDLWTYVSVGAGLIDKDEATRMEFLITAREPALQHTERLAMTAYYHHTETLGLGHTFPLGEPWLPGSALDYALISLPYPFGPDFEILKLDGWHAHIFWILPITASEYAYKKSHGLEALESAFDDAELKYWDAERTPVV